MSNLGWTCPKCGFVYAPHVDSCGRCNGIAGMPLVPCDPVMPYQPVPAPAPVQPFIPTYPPITPYTLGAGGSVTARFVPQQAYNIDSGEVHEIQMFTNWSKKHDAK